MNKINNYQGFNIDPNFGKNLKHYGLMVDLDRKNESITDDRIRLDLTFMKLLTLLASNGNGRALKLVYSELHDMHKRFTRLRRISSYVTDIEGIPVNVDDYTLVIQKLLEDFNNSRDYYADLCANGLMIAKSGKSKELVTEAISELIKNKPLHALETIAEEAIGIKYTHNDVLNVIEDKQFIKYMESRTKVIPKSVPVEVGKQFYGVFPKIDDLNFVEDLRLCVPEVTNLETYLINIYLYQGALEYYELIDFFMIAPTELIERSAQIAENTAKVDGVQRLRKYYFKF